MELSKKERLFLYNQYEILKKLSKDEHDKKYYELKQKVLESGFSYDYDDLTEFLYDEMPVENSKFVWEYFNLLRCLGNSYEELSEEEQMQINKKDLLFDGFDGNEEAKYLIYAEYILNDLDRYGEVVYKKKDLNSHWPKLDKYERMIEKWRDMREDEYTNLTFKQMKNILE